MRINAIIRIIFFSAAILILIGILVIGLGIDMYMADSDGINLPISRYDQMNTGSVDAAGIQNIQIDWVAGSITIRPDANTTQITITETAPDNEKYHMVYRTDGDTLQIQFQEDSSNFGISNSISKDLSITVPASWICDSLEIDTASSCVDVCDMTISRCSFDSASGMCNFSNCHVGELDIDTASGDVTFTGNLTELDCEADSGNCSITVENVPDVLCFEAASGNLELCLPENCGFTTDIDALSGEFCSDFATTKHDDQHVYGDGHCLIAVQAISGDVSIRRNHSANTPVTNPDCTEADCTESLHDHTAVCNDPDCTDESHGHTVTCSDTECTDESHGHSENHTETDSDSSHHSSKHHN